MSQGIVIWHSENKRVVRVGDQLFAEASSSHDRAGTPLWEDVAPFDIVEILKRATMVLHMQSGSRGIVYQDELVRVVRDGNEVYAEVSTERDRVGAAIWRDAPKSEVARLLKKALLSLDTRTRLNKQG